MSCRWWGVTTSGVVVGVVVVDILLKDKLEYNVDILWLIFVAYVKGGEFVDVVFNLLIDSYIYI